MTRAFLDGARRVAAAPFLVVGLSLVTLVTAAPLGWALHESIETHLGPSATADTVATGVDVTWWEEFRAEATGVSTTFTPRILGFAAVLGNLSDVADRVPLSRAIVGAVAAYLVLGTFLLGGVLGRLARQRALGSRAFFAACGGHFLRFCRLAVLAGLAYWWLFAVWHPWLFDDLLPATAGALTTERSMAALRVGLYVAFAIPLLVVNMVFDYAKIRTVVEDRRSMLAALLAAIRFIRRHPGDAVGLYALNGAVFLGVVASYAGLAPGPDVGAAMWPAIVVGQVYLVSRIAAKLVFQASQVAYFQGQLAHASYLATPPGPRPTPAVDAPEAGGDATSS